MSGTQLTVFSYRRLISRIKRNLKVADVQFVPVGYALAVDPRATLTMLTLHSEDSEMIRHAMLATASSVSTLAGTAMGRQMLARLIENTKPVAEPAIAILDFTGVDIATGSFLREAVVGFRDFCRNATGLLYPVVANANLTIEEELGVYLKGRNDAIWACEISVRDKVSNPHILGELDPAQMNTLELIGRHHPISATDLAKLRPNEGIGTTAWNNRLATLAAKGVVKELRSGKSKLFSPVMEAI